LGRESPRSEKEGDDEGEEKRRDQKRNCRLSARGGRGPVRKLFGLRGVGR